MNQIGTDNKNSAEFSTSMYLSDSEKSWIHRHHNDFLSIWRLFPDPWIKICDWFYVDSCYCQIRSIQIHRLIDIPAPFVTANSYPNAQDYVANWNSMFPECQAIYVNQYHPIFKYGIYIGENYSDLIPYGDINSKEEL